MIEFYIVKELNYKEEIGSYTAYGIGACINKNGKKETLEYISDVFIDRQKAEHLADLCNRLHLDPIHLRDVVDDAVISI